MTLAQFKYSIANQNRDFRAADAKETVKKFGETYCSFKCKYGARAVEDKLDFQIVTNQPIDNALLRAIDAISTGSPPTGDAKRQEEQFKIACGLSGKPLAAFARKLKVIGRSGSLPQNKNELASLLVDWSATSDPIAAARLGKIRELVRDKAGYVGTGRNLIRRTDVLAALQIGDPKDLLPFETDLVDVGNVQERVQLDEAVSRIGSMSTPLLIHGTGGVGKTVFINSLALKVAADHEVVSFDCFGGGAYRSPQDMRHLPRRGLIHIANTLASRGLCDPILPGSSDVCNLFRTFRRRLTQCLETISRMTPGRKLAIFIDAIDNAAFAAGQTGEDCFPTKLLESVDSEPIDGLKLIVSCRSERRPKTYARLDEFELCPFTKNETAAFLRTRLENVSDIEVSVAQARSGGNPRVLDSLVKEGRGLLDQSEINNNIELDDLIQKRIKDAIYQIKERGYEEKNINAVLAGLAALPPPVPMDEYAAAYGMEPAAIESFASDLSPLLKRTNQGLMFRDEPTETLIYDKYAKSPDVLERVASNLLARQDKSVYAARALPRLLQELDDGEQLFELAFDVRIPNSITSAVGKRNIRYARLKAATLHAARNADYNRLVQLLVELSTIAEVDQRGSDYLLKYPDLVVAAEDDDARRRLFEIRTAWPGTRHARLAIVNILYGDREEATRHAHRNEEWIGHYWRTERKDSDQGPAPDQADIAAISFFLISEGHPKNAADDLTGWRDWYAFEVSQLILGYTQLASLLKTQDTGLTSQFINALSSIGSLAAALSLHELKNATRKTLCVKLADLCRKQTKLNLPESYSHRKTWKLEDGLRKSAAIALSLGLNTEAEFISLRAQHDRPKIGAFRDFFPRKGIFAYLFRVALLAAVQKCTIHENDLLPEELISICANIPKTVSGETFRERARAKLSKLSRKPHYNSEKSKNAPANAISDDEKQAAEHFLDIRLEPLLTLTKALQAALAASEDSIDTCFVELVEVWKQVRKKHDPYREGINNLFHCLGLEAVLFILWCRSELKPKSIERMLEAVHAHAINTGDLVRIIAILAQRNPLHSIAGEQSVKARTIIERKDDVAERVSLYGDLGRAMLPASLKEAAAYFRHGLAQMDAIGSGDYDFTNALLLFASVMKGDELEEQEFHTLSNICELNMGEEPEKFFWGAYGRGMAKAAGIRGLARLSRWDDRDMIALDNTLRPYLTGLLEAGKIEAKDALCLNRLAKPVEEFNAGTKEFAKAALRDQSGPDAGLVIEELITQFEEDNPSIARDDTLEKLCELAEKALGASHDLTRYLIALRSRYNTARKALNSTYTSNSFNPKMAEEAANLDKTNRKALENIAAATDPIDEASLERAINKFNALGNMYDLKEGFFSALRDKVPFDARDQYVRNIANLEHLYYYWKFAELEKLRKTWARSSEALGVYRDIAKPLIHAHSNDLVNNGGVSRAEINKISQFTGVPTAELVLEIIKVFSRHDSSIVGSTWLACANFISSEADEGQGQLALNRILSNDSSRIADRVTDGAWKAGCCPADNTEIAAGLIWRILGSPYAVKRWHAAHCIRRFAKFGRWGIIDKVVAAFGKKTAEPFQAPELDFYYLHARLWLLIALARAAIDHPDEVARYKDLFLTIIMDKDEPHVLMRHFAARALIACVDRCKLSLDEDTIRIVRNIDKSPHPRLRKRNRNRKDFDHACMNPVPEPSSCFYLDYDFNKYDVDNLGRVFGRDYWELDNMISGIVHKIDLSMTQINEGRERKSRVQGHHKMTSRFHYYREQLGWHALFIAAGKLLAAHPVTDDELLYEDDPWGEWLGGYGLTCKDGFWLSDGTDRTPEDISLRLLESNSEGPAITGDQKKIMRLAGLEDKKCVGKELIVEGGWYSCDGVEIRLSSALVSHEKAVQSARKLIHEKFMSMRLPCFRDDKYQRSNNNDYLPWIVCPSGESRLDEYDPYGVSVANHRPRLAQNYSEFCNLKRQDAFGRSWNNDCGTSLLRAEAWGRDKTNRKDCSYPGLRLICKSSLVKKILTKYEKELLLFFYLQRYEQESYQSSKEVSYSIGVVRIDKTLNVEYTKGCVNYRDKLKW